MHLFSNITSIKYDWQLQYMLLDSEHLYIQKVESLPFDSCCRQVVNQESLEAVDKINSPVVICVAVRFGTVRLIDNMEINV